MATLARQYAPHNVERLIFAAQNVLWKTGFNHADKDDFSKSHPALIDRNDATVRLLRLAVDAIMEGGAQ